MNPYNMTIATIAGLKNSASTSVSAPQPGARLILAGGRVMDPKNKIDRTTDLAVQDGLVTEVADSITRGGADRVLDCGGLIVMPGLLDMHVHLGDLFDIYESPIF